GSCAGGGGGGGGRKQKSAGAPRRRGPPSAPSRSRRRSRSRRAARGSSRRPRARRRSSAASGDRRSRVREARMSDITTVEGTGETVGEAKWSALRELERRFPGLDRPAGAFQGLSEGGRGPIGIG